MKQSRQWIYISKPFPRLVGVILLTMQGFIRVHNRSPKPAARLRHALTSIEIGKM